jgi:trk system potassium uptake protein TrkH
MNYLLVGRLMGLMAILMGVTMLFSLPWAFVYGWSRETGWNPSERAGFIALVASIMICFVVGIGLRFIGRNAKGRLLRKETMAIVGLSWILATVLGALPFQLSGTCLRENRPMNTFDAWFESQSGFSTTGATVLSDVEDQDLVPRSILFWRSSTHFLGGLGIMVLFVALLGQGSAGKALMRAEMPGPSQDSPQARTQHTALMLFWLYCGMNAVLTLLLWFEGLSWFDAMCHAFGTMATGGFSTYNNSVGHFHSPLIETTILIFMVLAGTNFMLLYFVLTGRPGRLLKDIEWRTYIGIILVVTMLIVVFGIWHHDFVPDGIVHADATLGEQIVGGVRYGMFQVVSILTTTGYGTHDFDKWSSFARGMLFLLMFVGGCAGSTGGGLKVIRHVLFLKILRLEIEHAFHPSVVRPLRLGGKVLEDQELRRNILVYFGLILVIFVASWMMLVTVEPDSSWVNIENKLIDSATGISATLNNIGPGLGIVGATQNYGRFSSPSKFLFTILMMMGRLELFVILVLFVPSFWRSQ